MRPPAEGGSNPAMAALIGMRRTYGRSQFKTDLWPFWHPPAGKRELTVPPNETEATTRPDPIGDWTTRARSLRVARESLDEMRRPLFQNEKRQQAGYEPPGGFKGCLRSSSGRVQIRGRSQASSPASGLRPTPSAIALSSGSSTTGRLGRGTKRVTARTPPRWPP
jgi:hypothetical protein